MSGQLALAGAPDSAGPPSSPAPGPGCADLHAAGRAAGARNPAVGRERRGLARVSGRRGQLDVVPPGAENGPGYPDGQGLPQGPNGFPNGNGYGGPGGTGQQNGGPSAAG